MTQRLRWMALLALAGCYFETPTHKSDDEDDDAAIQIEPVGGPEGGQLPSDGATMANPPDSEAGTPVSTDGGMDANVPAVPPDDASMGIPDSGVDGGPQCMCDAGLPVCLPSGQCGQCDGNNKSACMGTDKPVCDVASSTCVACNEDKDCPSPARAKCNVATHACVPCDAKAQCAHVMGLNVCTAGNCVQCSASEAAACMGTTKPYCATNGSACVACNVNRDCTDPQRPTCDGNVCRACRNDTDCSGKMSGATALDACYNGQCVDCRVNASDTKQDIGCTARACNPATRTCTGAAKDSVGVCQACVADAECVDSHRCIALNFAGRAVGGYCMREAPGCAAPYLAAALNRPSLSGAPAADYCGITEATTSCEAIKALSDDPGGPRPCPGGDASACQARGAMCETVNGGFDRCTYRCVISGECPTAAPCGGPEGAKYCGYTN